jgi:hypothetical protein
MAETQSQLRLSRRRLDAMAALVILALFIVLDVVVLLGLTPDTRDPEYSLGRVVAPRTASDRKGR